ncbi:hypothetical protein DFH09DRAFT_1096651 [Mycena vulgaris]|nr:hypothetical protein DFH09DRAFT_1096651 [Mycena vulgaris]
MQSQAIPTLRLLANIITEAVKTMEAMYMRAEQHLPSLGIPFNPEDPAESLAQDPDVAAAVMEIIAAASQITATVTNPPMATLNAAQAVTKLISGFMPAKLRRRVTLIKIFWVNVAPSRVFLVADSPLAQILRLLATHNIFREVFPNVFASNRISSVLDKNESPKALFENWEDRLMGTSGLTALVEFFVENCFRSSAHLADTIMAPKAGIVPYNRAFNTDQPMYYWLQRSENAYKLKRFGLGMKGTASSEPADTIFQGFDWTKRYLAHTVEEASAHWNADFKEHIERKMVEFQGHDFFNPQPVQNATVFFLRYIIHNWDDARAVEILKRLRAAVLPTTQLAVVEKILAGACHNQGSDVNKIPGAFRPCARAPLLANWGVATSKLYFYDIGVHTMLGGGGRTLDGFVDVLKQAGWDLVQGLFGFVREHQYE